MKYWKLIFWPLGALPIGFVASLLSFYFHAGQILGYLPHYNHPDPKELDIYAYYSSIVNLTAAASILSFPAWTLLAIIYIASNRSNIQWPPVAISGLLQLLGIAIFLSGIFGWYMD